MTEQRTIPADDLLKAYASQTTLTDPGKYCHLYDELPQSLDSLCLLIKRQLIHPLEARQKGYSLEQVIREGAIENTEHILEALLEKDSLGLLFDREPDDRLVLACDHHAMLLTSILRSRDIPVRMRFGFARYFEEDAGIRFGHVICEVWNDHEQRWMLVDPDRMYVDFPSDWFDFSQEAWGNITRKKMNHGVYISSIGNGLKGAVNLLAMDGAHVLMRERMNWVYPVIALQDINSLDDLGKEEWSALEEAATYLSDPDLHFHKLDSLYTHYPGFQPSDSDYEDYCRMMEERD